MTNSRIELIRLPLEILSTCLHFHQCGYSTMSKVQKLPPRSAVKPGDCWNLSSLFKSDAAWESAFKKWEARIHGYAQFAGKLAESPKSLAACLEFDLRFRPGWRTAGHLRPSEGRRKTTATARYQRMLGRFQHAASDGAQMRQLHPAGNSGDSVGEDEEISRRPRTRPAPPDARATAALQAAHAQSRRGKTAGHAKPDVGNAEPRVPPIERRRSEIRQREEREREAGRVEQLVAIGVSAFAQSQAVRKTAFHQYYAEYQAHENTLAATLGRLDPARRLLRQGPRISERAARRRCSPTTCRRRFTTI